MFINVKWFVSTEVSNEVTRGFKSLQLNNGIRYIIMHTTQQKTGIKRGLTTSFLLFSLLLLAVLTVVVKFKVLASALFPRHLRAHTWRHFISNSFPLSSRYIPACCRRLNPLTILRCHCCQRANLDAWGGCAPKLNTNEANCSSARPVDEVDWSHLLSPQRLVTSFG
jgi:hypothetical protein